jgi:hypothetical protein
VAGEDGAKAFFVCAVSDDDGETWSTPTAVESFSYPVSRPHLRRLPVARRHDLHFV